MELIDREGLRNHAYWLADDARDGRQTAISATFRSYLPMDTAITTQRSTKTCRVVPSRQKPNLL